MCIYSTHPVGVNMSTNCGAQKCFTFLKRPSTIQMISCTNTGLRRERVPLYSTGFSECARMCNGDPHCDTMRHDPRTNTCELEGPPRSGWVTCRRQLPTMSRRAKCGICLGFIVVILLLFMYTTKNTKNT